MKNRALLTLAVSLGMAGLAAVLANNWISQRLGATHETTETGQVVVAAVDIPVGTQLEATHLKVLPLPRDVISKDNFTNLEEAAGRVATQPIYAGEILLERRFIEHVGGSPLAAVVEQGKRALTVRVDDVIGVAGFLLPGNRVDVVSNRRKPGTNESVTRTIVENLKVLAVDQTVSSDKNDPVIVRAVTLEVTPRQAEQIVKATEEGKVQLTLRNPMDVAQHEVEYEPEPIPVVKKPVTKRWPRYGIDIIRGTEKSRTVVNK